MIDFRFHIVSIVSIFIALAVGIVLGAGPLQNSIGTTLTSQVQSLRAEADGLRSQLSEAESSVNSGQDYAEYVASAALAGRLKGRTVAIVASRDAIGTFSTQIAKSLQLAGATVTTTVTLADRFTDPSQVTQRAEAAASAAQLLGIGSGASTDAVVGAVLARLLVHGTSTTAAASAQSNAALLALTTAGIIQSTDKAPPRAELAVVLGSPVSGEQDKVTAESATLTAMLSALRSGSQGVVVAGGVPATVNPPEVTTTLVGAVREDKTLVTNVSTVDHADSVSGSGLVVIALAEQAGGSVGHYGTSAGATSDVPALP